MPSPIHFLYPTMSYERFLERKKDPIWLYESVRTCEACCKSIESV